MSRQQETGRRGRPGPDPAKVAEAARLRGEGVTDVAIAAGLGVDRETVRDWLGPSGRQGRPRAEADEAELVRLRDEDGLSWRAVGARVGLSHERARRRYEQAKNSSADS